MKSHPFSPFAMLLGAFLVLLLSAWVALGLFAIKPSLAATLQQQAITLQVTPLPPA